MAKAKVKKPQKKSKPAPKSLRPATSKAVALVAKEKPQSSMTKSATLSLANPNDVMAFGKVLKSYIGANGLSTKINDKDYAHVDGWKFAGMNFGLTAIPSKPVQRHILGQYITVLYTEKEFQGKTGKYKKDVVVFSGFSDHVDIINQVRSNNKISKEITKPYFAYECEVDIVKISDSSKVSYGVGFCSNLELLKTGFDEYSVNSMSQTRAIGKGFRNLIGFVMNAAGIETTPAEEMDEVKREARENSYVDVEYDVPKNKQICSDYHFKQILTRLMKGETNVINEAEEHMVFTTAQKEAIDIALKSKGND